MKLEVKNLTHSYFDGPQRIEILKGLSFSTLGNETVAIMGPSGCGKSTLIACMGGLLRPQGGEVQFGETRIDQLRGDRLVRFRAENIGIVFQQFHLIGHLTALENVALPLELRSRTDALVRAETALAEVGLSERHHHFPHQLSRGECQRVAVARVLVNQPKLILADEPTGSLDQTNGRKVVELLIAATQRLNAALVMVTHDLSMASLCQRRLSFTGGHLEPA